MHWYNSYHCYPLLLCLLSFLIFYLQYSIFNSLFDIIFLISTLVSAFTFALLWLDIALLPCSPCWSIALLCYGYYYLVTAHSNLIILFNFKFKFKFISNRLILLILLLLFCYACLLPVVSCLDFCLLTLDSRLSIQSSLSYVITQTYVWLYLILC